ncbi:uncharacterized protein BDZ99DRAFT_577226 [Mytilinidion resinicola]|uniref:F-box domain-containing protein n=1 Tax=Mytilinidion resinicola TaxID=574789 RepID=A0A6A6XZL9_9PEZI|nr:uncharacterized protein BDZ99DRAFT_577226 [Mytilinidion resinicola]KAF2802011.1 hypothetical protein BDZ99DRAFT_577226 [Mytilinidion resinicola]
MAPWAVDFADGLDRFPRLEELSIQGHWEYFFSPEDLKQMGSRGLWKNLRILRIKPHTRILPHFIGCVPSLEVLETSGLEFMLYQIHELNFSPAPLGVLRKLHIEGPEAFLRWEDMSSVSKTLTHLTLHNTDRFTHCGDGLDRWVSPFRNWIADPHALPDIEGFNLTFPNLTHLTVDMWRERKWPYLFLASLAQFKNLHDLTLFVEYSKRIGGRPAASQDACRHIFEYVQDRKIGNRLHRLVLTETPEASYHYAEYLRSPVRYPTPIRDFICALAFNGELSVHEENYQWVSDHCLYTRAEPQIEKQLQFSWSSPASIRTYLHWTWKTRKSGHRRTSRPLWSGRRRVTP